jgi:L-ascorbate metabolism protein UlaG (beta-lactamase superfamily)
MKRRVPWTTNTLVLRQPGTSQIGDIMVIGYAGKHADPWGKEFGQSNTVWLLQVAHLRIVHLGDNGPLRDETIRELGRVDVLMMPIDSQFHILKADQIAVIRSKLSPRILIPMHYRHADLETGPNKPELLGGIEEWAKGEATARYLASHQLKLSFADLPKGPEVVIFKHSPLVTAPPKTKVTEQ